MTESKTLTRDNTSEDPKTKSVEPKRLFDMSATQLAAGALAAMTSAVIGARLGLAGTVMGAALGSIVAGVAGSLYTTSLSRTKEKITSAFVGRVGDTTVEVVNVSDDTAIRHTGVRDTGMRDTGEVDGWHWDTAATEIQPAAVAPPSSHPVAASAAVDQTGKPAIRLPWKAILVSTAAVFLLALVGITGFELASGQAISGGDGTTIGQVSQGRSGGSDTPTPAPSSNAPSDASTMPSSEPSTSASSDPSAPATSGPSSEPTQSSEPSTGTTQSSEPSASSDATGNATENTASGDGSGANAGAGTVTGG